MEQFLNTVPGIVTGIGMIILTIVVGGLYVVGLWKGKKDNADDRLINILKTTVDELEIKVSKQTIDILSLTKEVHELKRDNEKYIDIFKGRDERTQEFYKQGFESMKIASQTHDLVTTMATSIQNTNNLLEKLIELLSKNADVITSITKK